MRISALLFTLPAMTLTAAAQEHRELDAHVHGVGEVNLAIDGAHLLVELHAPGMDIVGFEHAASSEADHAAIEEALGQLELAASVLSFPPLAGCEIETATAELHGDMEMHEGEHDHEEDEHHDDDHDHDHEDEHDDHDDDHEHHGDDDGGHTEFEVSYLIACTSIENLTSLAFSYFDHFAHDAELRVQAVGPAGASAYTVTATNPEIDLSDLI